MLIPELARSSKRLKLKATVMHQHGIFAGHDEVGVDAIDGEVVDRLGGDGVAVDVFDEDRLSVVGEEDVAGLKVGGVDPCAAGDDPEGMSAGSGELGSDT